MQADDDPMPDVRAGSPYPGRGVDVTDGYDHRQHGWASVQAPKQRST